MAKVATSMAQLEQIIMDELASAMNQAKTLSENDVKRELQSFYSQGNPRIYHRTHQLGNSMKSYGVNRFGKTVEFYIWLDQTVSYPVPNMDFVNRGFASYYSTPMIFSAAESHSSHILGKGGFWSRSLTKIKKNMISSIQSHF